VADQKNDPSVRFRVPPETKGAWVALCKKKRITQQDAIESLMRFAMNLEDDVLLSMILGQAEIKDDLILLVLKRMRGKRRRRPTTGAVAPPGLRNDTGSRPPHSPSLAGSAK